MIFLVLALWIPKCHAIDIPEDLPTIEALISLHKNMKSAEDDAMKNIAVSYGEQFADDNPSACYRVYGRRSECTSRLFERR
jgi:hypothetical protein